MKESVIIENFGPISKIQIDDIKPFTVLIGKSATGKSTIMKVIALCRYIYKLANIRSYYHLSNITRSPFRIDFRALMRENGLDGMLKSTTRILYSVSFDNDRQYTVEYSDKKLRSLPNVAIDDLIFLKGVFVSENRNAVSSWLGSSLERRSMSMGFYFDETLKLFLDATEVLKEIDVPSIGMVLSVTKSSNGQMQYLLHKEGSKATAFKLKEASSGMKSTVPLAVIVSYMALKFNFKDAYRRSVIDYLLKADRLTDFRPATEVDGLRPMVSIHVEEPELSLDPDSQILLQANIVDTLFHRASEDRTCKLMYATHSPYLANHINLLMAQWESHPDEGLNPDNVDVYLTEPDGTLRSVIVTDEKGRKIVDSEFLAKEIENLYVDYYAFRQ